MNIRSELRVGWFVDAYLKNPHAGLRLLGTGSGRMECLENMAARGRFAYTRLENLQKRQHGPVTPIYWNMIAENSHDVAVGWYTSANEKILELILYEMARTVKPGGHICLTISHTADSSVPVAASVVDVESLASLAMRGHLTPLHASLNRAPLGADPAWYDDAATDLLLVAEKPLNWQDIPPDESAFCCKEDTVALCEEFVPKSMQPWAKVPGAKVPIPATAAGRINYLVRRYDAATYLELSAQRGKNFSLVQAPFKVLACPLAQEIEPEEQKNNAALIPLCSDAFFARLATGNSQVRTVLEKKVPSLRFDIIFINGDHTFEQSLRDFSHSLDYAHENTLFILNASVPCDPYSALPDKTRALAYRRAAGLEGNFWHGEVFKTVFAIHDLFPQYSYCTLTEKSSQTVIWRAEGEKRTPLFSSLEHIKALGYFGMLRHAEALMPVDADMLPKLIGKALDPCRYSRPDSWKKLVYSSAVVAEQPSGVAKPSD